MERCPFRSLASVRWLLPSTALALLLAVSASRTSAVILIDVLDVLTLFEVEGLAFATYSTSEGTRLRIEDTDTAHSALVDLRGQTEAQRDLTLRAFSRERAGEEVLIAVDVAPLRGRAVGERIELDAHGAAAMGEIIDPALAELARPLVLGFRVVSEIAHPRTGIRRTTYHLESLEQAAEGPGVLSAVGEWAGFSESLVHPNVAPADVRLEITAERRRRHTGEIEIDPPGHSIPIRGWLAGCSNDASDLGEVAGCSNNLFQGASAAGRVIGHTQLLDLGGGAAVIDGRLRQHLGDGTHDVRSLLALRQYVGHREIAPPDVTGRYRGTYRSDSGLGSDSMSLALRAVLDETGAPTTRVEGSGLINHPRTRVAEWGFETLGTVGVHGQVVAINQGNGGRLILNAHFSVPLSVPPDPEAPPRIDGRYRLVLNDHGGDEGSFVMAVHEPPDPDHGGILDGFFPSMEAAPPWSNFSFEQ